MKKTVLFAASSAAVLLAGPVAAQTETGQQTDVGTRTASSCLGQLDRLQTESGQAQLPDALRNDIRQLEEAARILAERDQEDACNSMVQSIEEIRQSEEENLRAGQQNRETQSALPITERDEVVKASSMNGATVRNLEDQELGTIEDAVIDPRTGKVSYVVLSHGGFVGVGEKLIAVPWDQLRVVEGDDTQESYYVLSVSSDYLNQREGLSEQTQDWPAEVPGDWNPDEQEQDQSHQQRQ